MFVCFLPSDSFSLSMCLSFSPWRSLHAVHLASNSWPFFSFLTVYWVGIFCQFATKCGAAIVRVMSKKVGRWRPCPGIGWLDLLGGGRLESVLPLKSPHSTLFIPTTVIKGSLSLSTPFLYCGAADIRSVSDKIQTSNKLTRLSLQR